MRCVSLLPALDRSTHASEETMSNPSFGCKLPGRSSHAAAASGPWVLPNKFISPLTMDGRSGLRHKALSSPSAAAMAVSGSQDSAWGRESKQQPLMQLSSKRVQLLAQVLILLLRPGWHCKESARNDLLCCLLHALGKAHTVVDPPAVVISLYAASQHKHKMRRLQSFARNLCTQASVRVFVTLVPGASTLRDMCSLCSTSLLSGQRRRLSTGARQFA